MCVLISWQDAHIVASCGSWRVAQPLPPKLVRPRARSLRQSSVASRQSQVESLGSATRLSKEQNSKSLWSNCTDWNGVDFRRLESKQTTSQAKFKAGLLQSLVLSLIKILSRAPLSSAPSLSDFWLASCGASFPLKICSVQIFQKLIRARAN